MKSIDFFFAEIQILGIKTSAKSIDFVKKTSNVREIEQFCGENQNVCKIDRFCAVKAIKIFSKNEEFLQRKTNKISVKSINFSKTLKINQLFSTESIL